MPASASRPRAATAAGVSSSGWLKCVLMKSGWYCLSIVAELGRDPLGQVAGDPAADPDDLEVRDGPEPGEDGLEPPVVEQQRVAAGHDDVADLGVLLEVLERALELRHRDLLGIAHLPPPGAEPAVAGADRGDEEERPVGIAVRDVGHRAVGVLVERVDDAVHDVELLDRGDVLPPDRVVGRLDQVDHGRRDPELEVLGGLPETIEVGEVLRAELGRERLERLDRVGPEDFLPGFHDASRPSA